MLWHEHPTNGQRAAAGLPAVNSVWLDGLAMPAGSSAYDQCYTDLPALTGLIKSAAAQRGALDTRCSELDQFKSASLAGAGRVLIAADPLNSRIQAGDYRPMAVWQLIADLLDGSRVPAVVVLTGDRRLIELEIRSTDRWTFWRNNDTDAWFEWSNRDH